MSMNLEPPVDGETPSELGTLVALMYAATDSPPPAGVDIAGTMRDGLRERRRRRLIPAAGALAVLAVAAGAIVLRTPAPPTVGASPAAPSASTTRTAQPAPDRFDPLVARLHVGWVPPGLEAREPSYATGAQYLEWTEPRQRADPAYLGGFVQAILYAANVQPWQFTVQTVATTPAPESGLPGAVWITAPTQGTRTLAWRWAPNAWAVVRAVDRCDGCDQQEAPAAKSVVLRIAGSVTTQPTAPIRMPFSVARPAAPLVLTRADLEDGPGLFSATLEFGFDRTAIMPAAIGPAHDALMVNVVWSEKTEIGKKKPNRTIDGTPAFVEFGADWGDATLYPGPALEITVYVDNAEGRGVIDEAAAIALVRSVEILGGPDERVRWTSTPLR